MNQLITFGKYNGQPVEVLRQDPDYVDWLMAQDWFSKRHSNIKTLIVNNFGEPSETPEHNALQARFLDDNFTLSVIRKAFSYDGWMQSGFSSTRSMILDSEYEHRVRSHVQEKLQENEELLSFSSSRKIKTVFETKVGWDVQSFVRFDFQYVIRQLLIVDHYSKRFFKWPGLRTNTVVREPSFRDEICFELKPSIGDEYPRILREVKSRRLRLTNPQEHHIVFALQFTAQGATENQVREIFSRANIALVIGE